MENLAYKIEDESEKVIHIAPKRKPNLRKNKTVAVMMLLLGAITIAVSAGFTGTADITVMIFMTLFAVPLFFAKQDYIG